MSFACVVSSGSESDRAFDRAVGALEEMLIDADFVGLQTSFMRAHCHEFDSDASSENKLVYTTLFDEYQARMEEFLSAYLTRKLGPSFSMESFLSECEARGEEQLCGDVFDVLTNMSDFDSFKQLMLSEKNEGIWHATSNSVGAAPAAADSKPASS